MEAKRTAAVGDRMGDLVNAASGTGGLLRMQLDNISFPWIQRCLLSVCWHQRKRNIDLRIQILYHLVDAIQIGSFFTADVQ